MRSKVKCSGANLTAVEKTKSLSGSHVTTHISWKPLLSSEFWFSKAFFGNLCFFGKMTLHIKSRKEMFQERNKRERKTVAKLLCQLVDSDLMWYSNFQTQPLLRSNFLDLPSRLKMFLNIIINDLQDALPDRCPRSTHCWRSYIRTLGLVLPRRKKLTIFNLQKWSIYSPMIFCKEQPNF